MRNRHQTATSCTYDHIIKNKQKACPLGRAFINAGFVRLIFWRFSVVNYLKLRPKNLNSPEFRHLWLLLFWPVFGLLFSMVEKDVFNPVYTAVHSPLDDMIPFCEWFMIPYMFWFVFLVGMIAYLLLFDVPAFRRFQYFVMLTYGVTMLVYIIYPTKQELRPDVFPRDNFMTRFIANFYAFDTNTNVCPSLHVVGSMAVAFGAWDT